MVVIGYTDTGAPCGASHGRCRIPDEIVLEIRDRAENRREACAAIAADLRARDYVVSRSQVHRIATYEQRVAVAHEYRRETTIRQARREQGLTRDQLAAAAGVHVKTLMRIELGQCTPRPGTLQRLARVLGWNVVTLWGMRRG